jgi:hypothetical protein
LEKQNPTIRSKQELPNGHNLFSPWVIQYRITQIETKGLIRPSSQRPPKTVGAAELDRAILSFNWKSSPFGFN